MIKVPTVGSKIKIRTRDVMGPSMIPPRHGSKEYEGEVIAPYKWLSDREFCLTGNKDFPIRVINMSLVEDIQLIKGSLREVNTDVRTFEVSGSKGNKYTVTSSSRGWTCTCTGFQFRKQCKHIAELSNQNESSTSK